MARYNKSFVTDEPEGQDTREGKKSRSAIEEHVVEECNDVNKWNMDHIMTRYINHRRDTRVKDNNLVFGAENVLHLPEKWVEMDKIVLSRIRNMRRNAVHI